MAQVTLHAITEQQHLIIVMITKPLLQTKRLVLSLLVLTDKSLLCKDNVVHVMIISFQILIDRDVLLQLV